MDSIKLDQSARIVGKVSLGKEAYIAQGSVVRSENESISLGNKTWVLENSVMLGSQKNPVHVGSKTVFGHKCIVIGAEIGDLCEIGNGTVFLPGSKIGNMCIFGEGTLIPEGVEIPDESVVVGRPGRIIRKLTDEDRSMIKRMRGGDISISPIEENRFDFKDKESDTVGKLYTINGKHPEISSSAYIYDTAEINGDVKIGNNSVVASGVRIIGNTHGPVIIGNNVQILENTVLHLLPDNQLIIEDDVTIGPGCIIHGTTIGKGSVVESGAIVCDYSKLGANTLVKSGSLIKQRSEFGNNEILEGFPAKSVGNNDNTLDRPSWAIFRD